MTNVSVRKDLRTYKGNALFRAIRLISPLLITLLVVSNHVLIAMKMFVINAITATIWKVVYVNYAVLCVLLVLIQVRNVQLVNLSIRNLWNKLPVRHVITTINR